MNIEPKVGQWWRNRACEIAYVAFDDSVVKPGSNYPILYITSEGSALVKKNGCSAYSEREDDEDLVEHLPDCTGFDWVPEKWPKYYEPINHQFIFAKRMSGDMMVSVRIDGQESTPYQWQEHHDGIRKQITEDEALSRIKPVKRRLKCWCHKGKVVGATPFFSDKDPGTDFNQVFCDADGFYVEVDR